MLCMDGQGEEEIKYLGGQMGKKISDLPRGQIKDPLSKKYFLFCSFQKWHVQSPSPTLKGLYELTQRPLRGLNLSSGT